MSYMYGWGAAVVILGALFKINHFPGATMMLLVGMGVEAVIFMLSAFEPLHEDIDWAKVYPELKEGGTPNGASSIRNMEAEVTVKHEDALSKKLEEMLAKSNVTQETFDKLGAGLQNLTNVTTNISNVSNVIDVNSSYANELEKMTANMSMLNESYAKQQTLVQQQLEYNIKLENNLSLIMESFGSSVDDVKKYRTEINELTQKVTKLNNVYSTMLNAISAASSVEK